MDLRGKKNNITFIFFNNDFLSVFPCCDVFVFYLVTKRVVTCILPMSNVCFAIYPSLPSHLMNKT